MTKIGRDVSSQFLEAGTLLQLLTARLETFEKVVDRITEAVPRYSIAQFVDVRRAEEEQAV